MSGGPSNDDPAVEPLPARRAARIGAVQALYQMELAQTDLNDVIAEFMAFRLGAEAEDPLLKAADKGFFADLLRGVVRRQREIDPMVDRTLAEGWRLTRIDAILRAVLRAGTFELIERTDVPVKAVISEYIEVARAFLSEDEPKVVNGVLDKIAREVRPGALK